MMQVNWITCGIAAGLISLTQTSSTYAGEATFRCGIGIGIMESPSFKSYMKDMYFDRDQQGTLVSASVGGKISVNDSWAVVPAVEFFLSPNGYWHTTGFAAASLNLRYSFTQEPSFYLQAGPNYTYGTSDVEAKGGVGGVASLGYAFKGRDRSRFGPELEVGYSYMPVDSAPEDDSYYNSHRGEIPSTVNFGGPFLRVGLRF